jgi:hypothetical protein
MSGLLGGGCLGFLLGIRHALEPDHLAAISALLGRERRRPATLGLLWGIGHSASLLVVAALLCGFCLEMPTRIAQLLELAVGVVLIVLGVRNLHLAARHGNRGPLVGHFHRHDFHVHANAIGHVHLGRRTLASRPLLVGMMHGLAGSGALAALVAARMPSLATRIGYLVLFGLGSTVGMAWVTAVAGVCLRRWVRAERAQRQLLAASGVLSLAAAVALVWALARPL